MTSVSKPNVVLIHCHDLGRFLGCYGVETLRTPNLDALASEAAVFSQAFCTAPQCSPSRAALFTGRYPHQTGVMGLTHEGFDWDMREGERHLASLLGSAGYETVLVGVHHESKAAPNEEIGAQLGFDRVFQYREPAQEVTKRGVAELERLAEGERPFYLQLGYFEPHRLRSQAALREGYQGFVGDHIEPDAQRGVSIPPFLIDEPSARVELAELQGAVNYVDSQVGTVLRRIRDLGLDEQTIVLFTTDHGLALPRAKASLYDPGLEIALIVRWPARGWTGGRRIPGLVSNVDVVPTLLDAAGLECPQEVEGVSAANLLDGLDDRSQRQEIFAELTYHGYYDPRRCVRTDTHKLIANFTVAPGFMDSSQSWRPRTRPLVPAGVHPTLELYSLLDDPQEFTNLADDPQCNGVRTDLIRRLAAWMRRTDDPLLAGAVVPPLARRTLDMLGSTEGLRTSVTGELSI